MATAIADSLDHDFTQRFEQSEDRSPEQDFLAIKAGARI
jgi:hypothetical protein